MRAVSSPVSKLLSASEIKVWNDLVELLVSGRIPDAGDIPQEEPPQSKPLPGWREFVQQAERIEPADEPAPEAKPRALPGWEQINGTMERVQSSNVHSIGYEITGPGIGTLFVRFLDNQNGKRVGEGPLYGYRGVPISVWRAFQSANSKGTFVWDHLRVRGTVHGHQYPYWLSDTGESDYIPRKATEIGGEEYFVPRVHRVNGEFRRSQLPKAKAYRGEPNRGAPKRGEPNRGR